MTAQVPFHRVVLDEEEVRAAADVLRSGWLTTGPRTARFEEAFAAAVGAPHAVATSSGTAALLLAYRAVGIGPGDEVIVPTTTFTASAAAVVHLGARPVLADVDSRTMLLDPAEVARLRTPRTRAVVAVHFAGVHADLAELVASAGEGVTLVEDAAHALPSRRAGRHAGTTGIAGAFSFYATKTVTTGEGGMVVTGDAALAARVRGLRLHGMSASAEDRYRSGSWRYDVDEFGFKANLTDLAAELGIGRLRRAERDWRRRLAISRAYDAAFVDEPALELPHRSATAHGDGDGKGDDYGGGSAGTGPPADQDSWHLYVLRIRTEQLGRAHDTADEIRAAMMAGLGERGVGTNVHFIPLHLLSAYRDTFGYRPGDLPRAEAQYHRSLSLPIWPAMTDDDVARVTTAVRDTVRALRR